MYQGKTEFNKMSPGDITKLKRILCLTISGLLFLTSCSNKVQSNDVKESNAKIVVTVKDLTPPTITLKNENVELVLGKTDKFDLDDYVIIDDNLDHNLTYQVVGEYDLKKSGTYSLTIYAEDLDGNKATTDFQIEVKEDKKIEKEETHQTIDPTLPIIPLPPNLPTVEQPVIPDRTVNSPVPENKNFLFSDGYTYQSAFDACAIYGKSVLNSNNASSYLCTPIKEDGKYKGYLITFE